MGRSVVAAVRQIARRDAVAAVADAVADVASVVEGADPGQAVLLAFDRSALSAT